MELSLVEIWQSMGLLARGVAVALGAMGVASLAVSLDRWLVLGRTGRLSATFAARSKPLLQDRDLETLLMLTQQYERSPLARLVRSGLETYDANRRDDGVDPVEMARRELGRRLELLAAESRRGMGVLASVGSTAPFIGLFGTVIGIITAFQGIAASGGGGIAAVSAGIAEALIVTAVGLFVAIAAVLFFNYLAGKFDKLDMTMQHAASELLDYLESHDGRSDPNR